MVNETNKPNEKKSRAGIVVLVVAVVELEAEVVIDFIFPLSNIEGGIIDVVVSFGASETSCGPKSSSSFSFEWSCKASNGAAFGWVEGFEKTNPGLPPPRTRGGAAASDAALVGAGSMDNNEEELLLLPPPSLGLFGAGTWLDSSSSSSLPRFSSLGSSTIIFLGADFFDFGGGNNDPNEDFALVVDPWFGCDDELAVGVGFWVDVGFETGCCPSSESLSLP